MAIQENMGRTLCLCNTHASWGGGEKWHLEAAKALVMRGWHVIFLVNPACRLYDEALRFAQSLPCPYVAAGPDVAAVPEGVSAVGSLRLVPLQIKSLSFINPRVMARLVTFFRKEKVQTLLMGLPAEVKSVGLAAKMAGVPRILYRRGSAFATRNSWSNRYLYSSVLTSLIVNSKQMQEHNAAIMPKERIHLLPNGIDSHAFDASLEAATPYALPVQRRFTLGNAARLSPEKGQHYLVRMMADIKNMTSAAHSDVSISYHDIQLIIAGDGDLREELEALAHELGVHDHISFLGFQDSLYAFWKSVDLFVFSSLREGLPNVLAESMMAGVPMVAFDVSSIPELVTHGENGVLVMGPPEAMSVGRADASTADEGQTVSHAAKHALGTAPHATPHTTPSERLAVAVLDLLRDEKARQLLSQNGRARALSTYSQSICMDSLEEILLN